MAFIAISFFFFNDTATTEIYTLSLHDALPICISSRRPAQLMFIFSSRAMVIARESGQRTLGRPSSTRSEEHTSELQSHSDLVCRLLLEKKKEVCYDLGVSLVCNKIVHYPYCRD